MSRSRAVRAQRRNQGSDLARRVLVAIPAIVFAVTIITVGGTFFAAGVVALGFVCLHELFRMYEPLRPVKLAGFLALAGMAAAALWGGEHELLLATMAAVPVVFEGGALGRRRRARDRRRLVRGPAAALAAALNVPRGTPGYPRGAFTRAAAAARGAGGEQGRLVTVPVENLVLWG